METSTMVAGLRKYADLLEQHPKMARPSHNISMYLHLNDNDAASVKDTVEALGSFKKSENTDKTNLMLIKEIVPGFIVEVFVPKTLVCVRKVVGVEHVKETVLPAHEEIIIPAHDTEIVEWECGSLLAAAEEA